ncbi:helicase-exonuclease AddAB subunit AddB [Paenibacillus selenitireducens]|uniref:ATP-dependent helicase/deoxyribonuclease subunit B n=1 Tax=Paenibacillus selenitireducens TaxID=1324314 RepID=A0A1T2XEU0_9BACL|nr:helicase-exonuclease AddAB subunit AddB [Paenibacillus selenitireducens]OPA78399.1 helicase-exonuclease AddAB subunit AddB [Paenibacillus selenitireducens]
MSIQFIIGRSGSGKTYSILNQVRDKLRQQPEGPPLIIIVPEQGTFQVEHAIVSSPDVQGMIRGQVLSFRRLAFRIMQERGGTALLPIDDDGKKMLLYKIIHRQQEALKLFGKSADQLGFVDKLNELYNEFKRYCLDVTQLDQHLQFASQHMSGQSLMQDKLHDITSIYREFEDTLANHYVDSEHYLELLASGIPDSTYIRDAEIWIDGFHGFTPQEYQVLEQLIQHAKKVTVTCCVDKTYDDGLPPHELELFHPTATTYMQVRALAEQCNVAVEASVVLDSTPLPRFQKSPMLSHLERGYDRRKPMKLADKSILNPEDPACGVSLYGAVNRRAEVEGVVREMLRLAREKQVRWREMAIMVRNTADYEELITTVFRDHGIPYFLDQKRNVLHHPLVEFIRSSLEIVQNHWRYDAVFRCIKTDFLLSEDGRIGRHEMDMLENYVLATGIQGSRWTDGKPWRKMHSISLDPSEAPAEEAEQELRTDDVLEQCRLQIVQPLHAFEKALRHATNVRGMCEAVYSLLVRIQAADRLDRMSHRETVAGQPVRAKEHRQLWGNVIDLLDQIVEMMGDEELSVELFTGVVETGLESIKLALVPAALDQVLIGSMDRTRSGHIRYCFMMGVNDGVIPARAIEDGVLTEQERERLAEIGLQLAPGIRRKLLDERFIIYNALTTPSEHLWVSYPLADEEGKTMLPSELMRHLRTIFPGIQERLLSGEPHPLQTPEEQLSYIAHPERTLSYLIVQLRQWRRGLDIADFWWQVFDWFANQPAWQPKLQMLLQSLFYKNDAASLEAQTSRKLYGTHLKSSVSRMEKYVSCPFAHFASHGLRLKERQLFRLEAPDIGQLFHAALSQMAMQFKAEDRHWSDLTPEECRFEAEKIVETLTPRLQGEILLSSKRFGYIARKLKDIVGRAAAILGEHARRGSFEPIGLELDFGPDKPLPSLQFTLDNGCTMEIVGRIDRVDKADGDKGVMLRVIDYKSSQTDLKLHEVYYGLSLQMLTYLDVLLTNAEVWLGEKAFPAGTLYFHVHNPLLQASNGLTRDQAEDQMLKRFKMKGLLLADREVVSLMDAPLEKGYSQVLPVAVKADGGFYSNASVATMEQWDTLRSAVRSTIRHIGTDITNGEVAIEPYKIAQSTACDHCSYKPVCQFDELVEGNHFKKLSKPKKDDVWHLLEEKGGVMDHE